MDTPLYCQPQSQTIYCYPKLTPSMGALAALGDCRVTVRAYVRDFLGHLWEILRSLCWWYFLVRTLNLRQWQWEVWSCRLMRGSQVAQWMWNSKKRPSKTCRRYGKGRPPIAKQSSETLHISSTGSLIGLKLKQPSGVIQLGDPAPLSASVFWSVITQWSPGRFHIVWAQGGEYLWCRNAVKTWC